jgi:hypothetical protein
MQALVETLQTHGIHFSCSPSKVLRTHWGRCISLQMNIAFKIICLQYKNNSLSHSNSYFLFITNS